MSFIDFHHSNLKAAEIRNCRELALNRARLPSIHPG